MVNHLENHLGQGYTGIYLENVDPADFIRGDLLGFKTIRSKCTNHATMWLDSEEGWMINSIQNIGVSKIKWEHAWARTYQCTWRIMVED
jgi:hypothetical protein